MTLNRHQLLMTAVPDAVPVLCAFGGRGAGRSTGALHVLLSYLQRYDRARGVFVRQILAPLVTQWEESQNIAHAMGLRVKTNRTELSLTLPNGSWLEFAPLADEGYFHARFRGESFAIICVDELATYVDLNLPKKLLGSLRHPTYPTRFLALSNPGPSGYALHKHVIQPASKVPRGMPFPCAFFGDKQTVFLHGTHADNEYLPSDYLANLRAAAASEQSFLRDARGDFTATEAALHLIDPERHFVRWDFTRCPPHSLPHVRWHCGLDWGLVSPACAVWTAVWKDKGAGPDGTVFPAGTHMFAWETHTADPASGYTKATHTTSVADFSARLKEHADALGFRHVPEVRCDDATRDEEKREFAKHGIRMRPAGKSRIKGGIARLNELLQAAAPPGGIRVQSQVIPGFTMTLYRADPALYIDGINCPYTLLALQNSYSDERNPDIVSGKFALAHAWDAARYACLGTAAPGTTTSEPLRL